MYWGQKYKIVQNIDMSEIQGNPNLHWNTTAVIFWTVCVWERCVGIYKELVSREVVEKEYLVDGKMINAKNKDGDKDDHWQRTKMKRWSMTKSKNGDKDDQWQRWRPLLCFGKSSMPISALDDRPPLRLSCGIGKQGSWCGARSLIGDPCEKLDKFLIGCLQLVYMFKYTYSTSN